MRIALVAPATPAALADLLPPAEARRAADLPGMGGTPIAPLARALVDHGHEVELVTLDPTLADAVELHGEHLRCRIGPYRPRARDRARDLFAAERRWLAALLSRTRVDVVHAHWTYEFAWAAAGAGAPLVVTAHDAPMTVLSRLPDRYRMVRAAMAWRARFLSCSLTAVSPYLAGQWRRQMQYRAPVAVVPNIAPEPRGAVTVRPGPARFLAVADDTRLKNVRALVHAFALLRARRPDATLALAGPGLGPGDALAVEAASSWGTRGVTFLGPVAHRELPHLLRATDVLVHPSLEEAHPMAVLEAMAAGLPVIGGRRSGGVPWTLGDGAAGLLVDVASPARLAEGMLRLADEPALRAALAGAGLRRAGSDFGAAAVVRGYAEVYGRALRRARGLPAAVAG